MNPQSEPIAATSGGEFAEHLRTVHFSLVLVAFALLAGSLLTKSDDAQRALTQLVEIQDLQPIWKTEWLEAEASKVVAGLSLAPIEPEWMLSVNDAQVPVHVATRWFITLPPSAWDQGGKFVGGWEDYWSEEGGNSRRFRSKYPSRLSDFKKFWDSLTEQVRITAAESISEEAVIWIPTYQWIDAVRGWGNEIYPPEKFQAGKLKAKKEAGGSFPGCYAGLQFSSAERIQWIRKEPKLASLANHMSSSGVVFSCKGARFELELKLGSILIPAQSREIELNGQAAFQAAHGTKFHYGTFEQTLPELDRLTKNFQDLTYDQLRKILAGEASRTSERVEMFGARIPGEALATWGIPILILVQIYFLLHLSTFYHLAAKANGLPSVAWIGLYPTWSAHLATFLSGVVLPLGVNGFLLYVQASKFLYWWEWCFACLGIISSSIIGFMSGIRLIRIWRTIPFTA